uniref:Uncharacterized protein n=1 Tax=Anguilla anguilla TaxID=7936 RepID=A0A0E9QJ24_ANGAN
MQTKIGLSSPPPSSSYLTAGNPFVSREGFCGTLFSNILSQSVFQNSTALQ